ncbi:membrane hypothetical protein [Tenacibaculum amylolyticum]
MTNNLKLLKYILLGILFASLLYAFEFFEKSSEEYILAKKEYLEMKSANKEALTDVKKVAIGTTQYEKYTSVNNDYKKSTEKYKEAIKQEKVFGFDNFQIFAFNLFPIISLLIYFILNLYKSFKNEPKNLGIKFIHGVFITFAFFKLFWIFKTFQDFSKPTYYLMTIFSAYFVALGVYLINRQQVRRSNKIKKKLLKVSYHALKNVKEEKLEEMAKVIEKPM